MARTVNPIRKELVKQNLLKGMDAKNAMIQAGYSPNTAVHSTENTVVKQSVAEIQGDIKDRITVEYILDKLEHEAQTAPNAADRIRATELLGKWRAMFTDKVKSDIELREDEIPERKHRLLDMVREITPQG